MSRMEAFFKDKIDWKFYNYLIDRLTKYEDKTGNYFSISICVDASKRFINGYYIYNTYRLEIGEKSGYDTEAMNIDPYVKMYNENGLFYNIELKGENYLTYDEKIKEIDIVFDYIKDRSIKVNTSISFLVVQPK